MDGLDEGYMPFHILEEQSSRIASGQGYTLDHLPESFLVQAFMLLEDVIGGERRTAGPRGGPLATPEATGPMWDHLRTNVLRLFGRMELESGIWVDGEWDYSAKGQLETFLVHDRDLSVSHRLSGLEICWRSIITFMPRIARYRPADDVPELVRRSISLFNRFAAHHSLGYRFDAVTKRIVHIESEVLFREAIEPAVEELHLSGFTNAQRELTGAFRYLRQGDYEQAIQAAYRAFESTVKYICAERGWARNPDRKQTSELLKTALPKLFPPGVGGYMEVVHEPLKRLAMIRDTLAAHGRGTDERRIDPHVVGFTINMAAAAIVLLIRTNENYVERPDALIGSPPVLVSTTSASG